MLAAAACGKFFCDNINFFNMERNYNAGCVFIWSMCIEKSCLSNSARRSFAIPSSLSCCQNIPPKSKVERTAKAILPTPSSGEFLYPRRRSTPLYLYCPQAEGMATSAYLPFPKGKTASGRHWRSSTFPARMSSWTSRAARTLAALPTTNSWCGICCCC